MNKDDVINTLGLVPLEHEGGFVKELYKSSNKIDGRAIGTTIYYLETIDSYSAMHVLDNDEIYYYHDGSPIEMLLVYEDHSEVVVIGKNILKGEHPQFFVPKGVYQGSHMLNYEYDYSLLSTSNAPGYSMQGLELATYDQLKDRCLDKLDLLKLLTNKAK